MDKRKVQLKSIKVYCWVRPVKECFRQACKNRYPVGSTIQPSNNRPLEFKNLSLDDLVD